MMYSEMINRAQLCTPKRYVSLILIVVAIVLANCNQATKPKAQENSFRATLDIHLNAIAARRLSELAPTISDGVVMISPDGDKMKSKQVFLSFHENWFRQKNWQWEPTILKTENTDSMGYALIQYEYIQKDSIDKILFRDNDYLVLIFKNTPVGWQLVHDQNTRIHNNQNK